MKKRKWPWLGIAAALVPIMVFAAGELSLNTSILYQKNGVTIQNAQNLSLSITGTPIASGNILLTSTVTQISFQGVTNAGYVLLVNSSTGTLGRITYGTDTNVAFGFGLDQGDVSVLKLVTNSFWAQGNASNPPLYYIIFSR